jgi:hypothetical protein
MYDSETAEDKLHELSISFLITIGEGIMGVSENGATISTELGITTKEGETATIIPS